MRDSKESDKNPAPVTDLDLDSDLDLGLDLDLFPNLNFQDYLDLLLNGVKLDPEKEEPQTEDYDIEKEVQALVTETRSRLKLTQSQLAKRSGVTQANISKIENGAYCPSLSVLQRIAKGFGKRLVVSFEDWEELE